MVVVAQLVRAPGCGSGGRGFETHLPPKVKPLRFSGRFFCFTEALKTLFKSDAEIKKTVLYEERVKVLL